MCVVLTWPLVKIILSAATVSPAPWTHPWRAQTKYLSSFCCSCCIKCCAAAAEHQLLLPSAGVNGTYSAQHEAAGRLSAITQEVIPTFLKPSTTPRRMHCPITITPTQRLRDHDTAASDNHPPRFHPLKRETSQPEGRPASHLNQSGAGCRICKSVSIPKCCSCSFLPSYCKVPLC